MSLHALFNNAHSAPTVADGVRRQAEDDDARGRFIRGYKEASPVAIQKSHSNPLVTQKIWIWWNAAASTGAGRSARNMRARVINFYRMLECGTWACNAVFSLVVHRLPFSSLTFFSLSFPSFSRFVYYPTPARARFVRVGVAPFQPPSCAMKYLEIFLGPFAAETLSLDGYIKPGNRLRFNS